MAVEFARPRTHTRRWGGNDAARQEVRPVPEVGERSRLALLPAVDFATTARGSIRAVPGRTLDPLQGAVARVFDVVVAGTLLLLSMPVLVVIAALVKATSRGPVLYRSERVGLGGQRYQMLKFRTMVPDADDLLAAVLAADPCLALEFEVHRKLVNDPRVSRIGRVLRPTGLDELPQLINVIRGEMSMVGPRPITRREAEEFGGHVSLVWSVKPGITGPWQIGGRSETSYDERVAIDVDYACNWSVRGDIALLARTVRLVASGRLRGGC
jgi:exopolysaccharide production protein ExoY